MRRALLAFALALVPAVAAAQFNLNINKILDTGKNIVDATKDVNEKQEAEIGAEYAAVLLGASPLLANPEVQRYVNRVGRWLSLNSERPDLNWQFGVLDTGTVNAFSTPGGYVLISRGLLERLHNEAELAGVLAHEVAHVVKKHHLTAMKKGKGMEAGAGAIRRGAVGLGSGLSGEGIGEHRFAQHLADGDEEVLDLGQLGPPGGAVGAIELVDQVFGHAFDVGPDFFHLGGALLGWRHPGLLSGLRSNG